MTCARPAEQRAQSGVDESVEQHVDLFRALFRRSGGAGGDDGEEGPCDAGDREGVGPRRAVAMRDQIVQFARMVPANTVWEPVLDGARASTADDGSGESSVDVGVAERRQADVVKPFPSGSRWCWRLGQQPVQVLEAGVQEHAMHSQKERHDTHLTLS